MIFHAKNYLNQPMFRAVIQKITLAQFFGDTVYNLKPTKKPKPSTKGFLNNPSLTK